MDTFYVESKNKFYCFYRQGMLVTVDKEDISKDSIVEQIIPREIDQIFYLNLNKIEGDPMSEKREFFIILFDGKLHFYDFNSQDQIQRYYTM